MPINELAQWAVLLLLGAAVLGIYWQLGQFLKAEGSELNALNGPPLRRKLPADLVDELRLAGVPLGSARCALVVVSEGCPRCSLLLARLESTGGDIDGARVAVIARRPTTKFIDALEESLPGVPVVADTGGRLSESLNVSATPTVIAVAPSLIVEAKGIEHDLDVVLSHA